MSSLESINFCGEEGVDALVGVVDDLMVLVKIKRQL